mmetsp:Transcript_8072/g.16740  ORF Transcript_8072/g.16740 Transcript_8072/m.16740 type:complete len:83 (-) Transcript_8072:158-406(-)
MVESHAILTGEPLKLSWHRSVSDEFQGDCEADGRCLLRLGCVTVLRCYQLCARTYGSLIFRIAQSEARYIRDGSQLRWAVFS